MTGKTSLIHIRNLTISSLNRVLVKGIDLDIYADDLLGVAGESGSGKTMLVRALLQILPKGVGYTADRLEMFGKDCLSLSGAEWRKLVGEHIAFIPQNTMFYLHPLMKIKKQITDGFTTYRYGTAKEGLQKAEELLRQVGFDQPQRILNSYAWELSGGMRQRVNIAMALMTEPDLLIADEPTTALDAAIGRQILELFMKISREKKIAVIMISHDLGVLERYSNRVMILYAGRMVELGTREEIFENPLHPYTKALMNVIPVIGSERAARLNEIPGFVPDAGREIESCIFAPRCGYVREKCREPLLLREPEKGHFCLCVGENADET